jgi:hypothetical protein
MDLPASAVVIAPAIAVIKPSFGAPLMADIGALSLVDSGLLTAGGTAIALSAIAMRADEEQRVTLATESKLVAGVPLRHEPPPCVIAGGTGQRHWFRGRLKPSQSGFTCQRVAELGTLPLQRRGSIRFPPLMPRYFVQLVY